MTSPVPTPLTSFVGRDDELSTLGGAFRGGARVVTLFGPPGAGKTRLALRFAELAGAQASVFCDLSTASSLDDVCRVVARELEIALLPGAAPLERIGHAVVAHGKLLFVLDNCEQVAAAVASAVARWCAVAPKASFLATSREWLGVEGEQALEVGPLGLPGSDDDVRAEATRLFVERARLVRHDFAVAPADAPAVTALVRRLDGLPLALELAAGCLDVFTVAGLLARLPRRLDDLANRTRTPKERQRTLRTAIDGSWSRLAPWERGALCQCTAFRGGFSLESAEALLDLSPFPEAPAPLEVVTALVRKSLLRTIGVGSDLGRRFGMYESIRAYAEEHQGEWPARGGAEARHLVHFRELARRSLEGPAPSVRERNRVLALEMDNLFVAHERALAAGEVTSALWLVLALEVLQGDLGSLLARLDVTLERAAEAEVDASLVLCARVARVRVWERTGPEQAIGPELDDVLARARRAGDRRALGRALARVAMQAYARDCAASIPRFEQALAVLGEAGDAEVQVATLSCLGAALAALGRFDDAKARFEEVVVRARASGDARTRVHAVAGLGYLLYSAGRTREAEETLSAPLDAAERDEPQFCAVVISSVLAQVLQENGRWSEADSHYAKACSAAARGGDVRQLGLIVGSQATLLHERGELAGACARYEEAMDLHAKTGLRGFKAVLLAMRGAALAELDLTDASAAAFEGAEAALEEALPATALALGLSRVHLDLAAARAVAPRDPAAAAALRARAGAALAACDPRFPQEDVRLARRLLERAVRVEVGGAGAGAKRLLIGPEARWLVMPSGARVEMERQRALRLIVLALARQRIARPAEALSAQALLAHGWPGERVKWEAGAGRVRNAISRLRALGLREVLVSKEDGYAFDEVEVALEGDAPAPLDPPS